MSELHLIRMVLDRRAAARVAPRRGSWDEGYALHAALCRVFADSPDEPATVPLRTFAIDDTCGRSSSRELYLLGYSEQPIDELRAALGDGGELVRGMDGRSMPSIAAGTTITFRLRAIPVVRTKNVPPRGAPPKKDKHGRPRSREVDAFLASRFDSWTERPPDEGRPFERSEREWAAREEAYRGWMVNQTQVDGEPSIQLEDITLESYRRARLHRRGGSDTVAPDAILTGRLVVRDADAFRRVLTRGIGRHRAFGYGMLRVRPG